MSNGPLDWLNRPTVCRVRRVRRTCVYVCLCVYIFVCVCVVCT